MHRNRWNMIKTYIRNSFAFIMKKIIFVDIAFNNIFIKYNCELWEVGSKFHMQYGLTTKCLLLLIIIKGWFARLIHCRLLFHFSNSFCQNYNLV